MQSSKSIWRLVDEYDPPGARSTEHLLIDSESRLREALKALSEQQPRVVVLESPSGAMLLIAIGGPFGAVRFCADAHHPVPVKARPGIPSAAEERFFVWEGEPDPIPPEELIALDDLLEVVASIYRTGRLPEWMSWSK